MIVATVRRQARRAIMYKVRVPVQLYTLQLCTRYARSTKVSASQFATVQLPYCVRRAKGANANSQNLDRPSTMQDMRRRLTPNVLTYCNAQKGEAEANKYAHEPLSLQPSPSTTTDWHASAAGRAVPQIEHFFGARLSTFSKVHRSPAGTAKAPLRRRQQQTQRGRKKIVDAKRAVSGEGGRAHMTT